MLTKFLAVTRWLAVFPFVLIAIAFAGMGLLLTATARVMLKSLLFVLED